VIGCGDDDDDASSSTGGSGAKPRKSGKMTPAVVNPGNTLDPNSTAGSVQEFHAMYDTLTRLDPVTNSIVPSFAQSFEPEGGDPSRWIFKIREAEFSDGVKVTAEDVKFSFEYYQNADNKSSLRSRVSTVDTVDVIDPLTVAINCKGPDPILPRRQHLVFVLPKHIFEDPSKGKEFQAKQAVGSGAYVPGAYLPGLEIPLSASPSSWRGTKGLDDVDLLIIKETTTRIAALEIGDIDMTTGLPAKDLERIDGFEGIVLGKNPSTQWRGWSMEYFDEPTNDVRVRLALSHSMELDSVIDEIYFGRAIKMKGQPLTENVFGHNADLEPFAYDPDKSRALLKDAGLPNGFKTTITSRVEGNAEFAAQALHAADNIASIGIDIDIANIETATWRDGIYGRAKRTPHIYHMPFSAFVLADASFAYSWIQKDAPSAYYDNPKFESKFVEGLTTVDDDARRKLYEEATFELNADPVALWTVQAEEYHAWREDKFADVSPAGQPMVFVDQIVPL
jgi:peptide/nickel transport system substrate-binding protein